MNNADEKNNKTDLAEIEESAEEAKVFSVKEIN
jgi:hypothetical protein